MPVHSPHPLYNKNLKAWKRCRDCDSGEDAMREAGTLYVPALPGMTGALTQIGEVSGSGVSDYNAYVCRGVFFGATYRTKRAIVGSMVTKPPQVKLPERIKYMEGDATGTGVSMVEFVKEVAAEVVLMGRAGILTDLGADGKVALIPYKTENIINWDDDFVTLQETVYRPKDAAKDKFLLEAQIQYREFRIEGEGVTCTLHTKSTVPGHEGTYVAGEPTVLRAKAGGAIKELPFTFISPTSRANVIEKAPMLDLVNVNVGHWRNAVDYENGVHLLGLPTPYMTGVDPKDTTPVPLGPNACIKIADPQGKFGYAGFEGGQMSELKNAKGDKEAQMAVLGARLLGASPKGVEAADTAKIHQSGENNVLVSLVAGLEEAVERALSLAAVYSGSSDTEVEVEFSREFSTLSIDPQLLTALTAAVQSGNMSLEAYVWNINRYGLLPDGHSIDDELQALEQIKEDRMAQALVISGGPQSAETATSTSGGASEAQGKPGEPQTKSPKPAAKTSAQTKGD